MNWFTKDRRARAKAPVANGAAKYTPVPTDTAASFENASQWGMELTGGSSPASSTTMDGVRA